MIGFRSNLSFGDASLATRCLAAGHNGLPAAAKAQ